MKVDINIEWYCENCNAWYNCINCNIMDELFLYNKKIIKILPVKKKKETKINKNINPYCGCWKKMLKSKFKNWAAFWCPQCKNK